MTLNDLGAQYAERGRLEQATDLLERAAALKRHALGPRHPDLAVTLNNLALAWRRREDFDRAAALYLEATGIFEESLGVDHPKTGTCRANAARCAAASPSTRPTPASPVSAPRTARSAAPSGRTPRTS